MIYDSFNQNRRSLRSNVWGGLGDKCWRLPMTRWRCQRKQYRVILVPGIFPATFFYDPTTSWLCNQAKPKIWLVQRFKPRRFENFRFILIWPDSAAEVVLKLLKKRSTWSLESKRDDWNQFSKSFFELVQQMSQVHFSFLLHNNNLCKGLRTLQKFPKKCQKIAGY